MNLIEFCQRFQTLQAEKAEILPIFGPGKKLLRELTKDPTWFGYFLRDYVTSPAFLGEEPTSVFDNEIRLYRHPDKSFMILAYLWDNRDLCPVHDHGAWGLIGSLLNPLREVKYRRLDEGQKEGVAELERASESLLGPGEVGFVLPLNEGIHQTGGAGDGMTVSLGVYGRSVRPGSIHFFDPAERKITRARTRIPFRRVLALRALSALGEAVGKTFLTPSLLASLPENLVREYHRSS